MSKNNFLEIQQQMVDHVTSIIVGHLNINSIQGFRDSTPVHKLHACCYDMQKFRTKQAVLVAVFKTKAVYNNFKSQ